MTNVGIQIYENRGRSVESGSQITSKIKNKLSSLKISIVLPVYNEEKTIRSVLEKIPLLPNYEIIVVDDGSKDHSREIVRSVLGTTLICHEKNAGYGHAIMDGVMQASGDIIVTLDSDGQHDPTDIPALLEPILNDQADLTLGSRYLGEYYYQLPFTSRFGEAILEVLIRIIFGKQIGANQGGFKAFKKIAVKPLFGYGLFNGFAFATETLLRALIKNLRVVEVPIHLHNRKHGKSRVRVVKLLLSLINCLLYFTITKYLGRKIAAKYLKVLNRQRLSRILLNS